MKCSQIPTFERTLILALEEGMVYQPIKIEQEGKYQQCFIDN